MSLLDKINQFDPDGPGDVDGGIFGLPFSAEEAGIVIMPVPWDVTVSYNGGTARGPEAIMAASPQLDLFDETYGDVWKVGIALDDAPEIALAQGAGLRAKARALITFMEQGGQPGSNAEMAAALQEVNAGCKTLIEEAEAKISSWLEKGKEVILLGGDHGCSLAYLRALAQKHDSFGILQIDAHMDLRKAYEGFVFSHASVMYNALQLPQVARLVQVGIRDFCREEADRATESERVSVFSDRAMRKQLFEGRNWASHCAEIVDQLPEKVYISFDIDGLDPSLCPHTGTPVPGGLQFSEAMYLLDAVLASGRKIIGADLVEVAPGADGNEWDGNVGARILYRLCGLLAAQ